MKYDNSAVKSFGENHKPRIDRESAHYSYSRRTILESFWASIVASAVHTEGKNLKKCILGSLTGLKNIIFFSNRLIPKKDALLPAE